MGSNTDNNPSKVKVIALVDMDCFYVQVEERDNPSIKGTPAAVVQYKAWKGGGIIAVNYEARARGVTRYMRGDDAKAVCPEIALVRVPEVNEKADLTKYRDAGKQVIDVLCEYSTCVERASVDEAYIDLTEAVNAICFNHDDPSACLDNIDTSNLINNFPLGFESSNSWLESLKASEFTPIENVKLAIGAEIVGRMRKAVYEKTGFRCSAGIAHNKVLAKLGCGINKPNKQTVIPHEAVPELYSQTKIKKVRMLGGQFGEILTDTYKFEHMSELLQLKLKDLVLNFGEDRGKWLYNLARGYDDEPVTKRNLPQSIGCSKNFMGREALDTKEKATFWISRLSKEIVDRIQNDLEVNNRRAKVITLNVKFKGQKALSRSCGKNIHYNPDRLATSVMTIMEKLYQQYGVLPINNLGIIASKLEDDSVKSGKIDSFYRAAPNVNTNAPQCTTSKPESSTSTTTCSDNAMPEPPIPSKSRLDEQIRENLSPQKSHYFCENSDDEDVDIDIEKFTPDSPLPVAPLQVDQRNIPSDVDVDIDIEAETETSLDELFPSEPSVIHSKKVEGSKVQISETIDENNPKILTPTKSMSTNDHKNPQQSVFFCSKSPTKIRKVVNNEKEKAKASSIVLALSKQTKESSKDLNTEDYRDSAAEIAFVGNVKGSKSVSEAPKTEVAFPDDGIDTKNIAKEYLQECGRCHKAIPLWEVASHSDFHVAFDLQEKFSGGVSFSVGSANQNNNTINKSTATTSNSNSATSGFSGQKRAAGSSAHSSRGRGSSKRGRPGKGSASNSKEHTNTLDSYFQPKNFS